MEAARESGPPSGKTGPEKAHRLQTFGGGGCLGHRYSQQDFQNLTQNSHLQLSSQARRPGTADKYWETFQKLPYGNRPLRQRAAWEAASFFYFSLCVFEERLLFSFVRSVKCSRIKLLSRYDVLGDETV